MERQSFGNIWDALVVGTPAEGTDQRVVEVVVSADAAPFLVGQRVLVKFMKPGIRRGVCEWWLGRRRRGEEDAPQQDNLHHYCGAKCAI